VLRVYADYLPSFKGNLIPTFRGLVRVRLVTDATSYPRITALKTFESTVFVSRDSSVGRATRYELDGPGGAEIFRTRPDRPWGPPSLLDNGYWVSFPGVKRPGRGINYPPPSNAEVKERVEQYLCAPSRPLWLSLCI
jgi:hypothetical protein